MAIARQIMNNSKEPLLMILIPNKGRLDKIRGRMAQ
jgi:hypothetical protein